MGKGVRSIFNSTSLHHSASLHFPSFIDILRKGKGKSRAKWCINWPPVSVCGTVLNDHLRFSHGSCILDVCNAFCAWHIGTQFIFPGVYPLLCTTGITLYLQGILQCKVLSWWLTVWLTSMTTTPPTPIGIHGKCTQLCHSMVVVQFYLVLFFSVSLLLLTVPTKILPSEFLWEAGTCPSKSKVKEEGQTYHFSK